MSLYKKHRPKKLEDILGNKTIIKSIQSVLKRTAKDIPRAFLFTGPSGCGKTTVARILAKEVGAEERNIVEVDSADFRGIDTIRDIRRKMHMRPLGGGKYRVYILDEMHKMTNDAQTALLKGLEDTPSHVFFMLCTTEPLKLLKTIRNRCTGYQMESLTKKTLERLLRTVLRKEKKIVNMDTVNLIIANSAGSPRLALVLLDKLIDLDEVESESAIEQALKEESSIIELCQELFGRCRWDTLQTILNELDQNEQPESIRRAITGYCKSVFQNSKDKSKHIRAGIVYDNFEKNTYDNGMNAIWRSSHGAYFDVSDQVPF